MYESGKNIWCYFQNRQAVAAHTNLDDQWGNCAIPWPQWFYFCVKRSWEYSTMHVSLWVIQGPAPCQNSPCFQCEDTIDVVLAPWPRNSWLSVVPNTRVTLLMGWWKPSWCQCWIHSDMFWHQPRITPSSVFLMLQLWCCVVLHCAEEAE